MAVGVSIVVPAHNAGGTIADCLDAIQGGEVSPLEVIVVDDASTDGTAAIAAQRGARVVSLQAKGGPAAARNRGVAETSAPWIVFLDADVVPHRDTLSRFVRHMEAGEIDAVFGAYDDKPKAPGLVSQFRNLLHHYTHLTARRSASTFWAGCGAVRRDVFVGAGGFDPRYRAPSIEDIELGVRMTQHGARILLDPAIRVCHLKRWTFTGMIRTDVLGRAWPWAQLMLRRGDMPDDLNTRWSQRWSCFFAWSACLLVPLSPVWPGLWTAVAILLGAVALLNRAFFAYLHRKRGVFFVLGSFLLYLLYLLYGSATLAVAMTVHSANVLRGERAPLRSEPFS